MFDLITGEVTHAPQPRAGSVVASVAAHVVLAGAVFMAAVLPVSEQLPGVKTMMAFVVAPPAPPMPPPPPLAPASGQAPRDEAEPVPKSRPAAPAEVPLEIVSEVAGLDFDDYTLAGVEGGVLGGMVGGVVGAIDIQVPPPPPPPVPSDPVRVGGPVKEPALLNRVEPVYPLLATRLGLEGIVILEANVDLEGRVENVRVLRSQGVLDGAALEAVRQWRYSPLLLNGQPVRFILTVVVSFSLKNK